MSGSDDEKVKKQIGEEKAAAEAVALGKSLARPSTKEGSGVRVVECVVHGGGGSMPPMMLMRTKYSDWAMITKLQLQVDELWRMVEMGQGTDRDDQRAIIALLKGVPPELMRILGAKPKAKQAWDTLKPMRVGSSACVKPRHRLAVWSTRRSGTRTAKGSSCMACGSGRSSTRSRCSATRSTSTRRSSRSCGQFV